MTLPDTPPDEWIEAMAREFTDDPDAFDKPPPDDDMDRWNRTIAVVARFNRGKARMKAHAAYAALKEKVNETGSYS